MARKAWIIPFIVLLLAPVFQSQARQTQQSASVQGVVMLGAKTPAMGYVVQIGDNWSYTDIKGHYRIDKVPFGKHMLQVKKRGKVVKQEQIDVNAPVDTCNVTL
ncbi:MAG: hypothetical protein P8Z30_18290 [Acidobacteriota bacterium]